jgi:hypothetical protein
MSRFFRPLLNLALAGLLLAGCAPSAAPAAPPARPSPTTRPPTPIPTSTPAADPRPEVARVLIVSVDGLRPEAVELAPMSVLAGLMAGGAYTLQARTVYPPATLPAHVSMLTGLCPEKHGVTWNDDLPWREGPAAGGLFELAHQSGLRTVMVVGKGKLRQAAAPQHTDVFLFINDRDTVIADRAAGLMAEGFGLMLVHFPTVDWMGHAYGWLSPEQLSVARRADQSLGVLLAALDRAGLGDTTLVIVTADHGGSGQSHGSRRPEDMTVPWVLAGPGVLPLELEAPVSVVDTAATAAWALGLPLPEGLDGRPLREAFGGPAVPAGERCP